MAECHPVGFQWVMEAKARGAKVIHIDPRYTRTSALASPLQLGGFGLAVMTLGLLLVMALPHPASALDVAWRLAVCGFGFGFFQSPNNRLMIASAPRERAGAGSGMLSTSRLVGQTTGSALVALLFAPSLPLGVLVPSNVTPT